MSKTLTRAYETSGLPGRYKEFDVGTSSNPTADMAVNYYYDTSGRVKRVTGPGLPSYGADYGFLADSDSVEKTEFKSGSSTVVASSVHALEDHRDLLKQIDNKWGGTTFSKYAYASDNLARKTSVTMTSTSQSDEPPFTRFAFRAERGTRLGSRKGGAMCTCHRPSRSAGHKRRQRGAAMYSAKGHGPMFGGPPGR